MKYFGTGLANSKVHWMHIILKFSQKVEIFLKSAARSLIQLRNIRNVRW